MRSRRRLLARQLHLQCSRDGRGDFILHGEYIR
jgi:hypothetical protein